MVATEATLQPLSTANASSVLAEKLCHGLEERETLGRRAEGDVAAWGYAESGEQIPYPWRCS
jgi:hypothetical protein